MEQLVKINIIESLKLRFSRGGTKIPETISGFSNFLEPITDKERKNKIAELLTKVEALGFHINVYEVQIETKRLKDKLRKTKTLCCNYSKDQSSTPIINFSSPVKKYVPLKEEEKEGWWSTEIFGRGQTAYSFITNRSMWITAKNKRELSPKKNYEDKWSVFSSEQIPEIWLMDKEKEPNVKTAVLIPLIFPKMHTNFGLIYFGSNDYIEYNETLREHFDDISKLYAIDYVEKKINEKI